MKIDKETWFDIKMIAWNYVGAILVMAWGFWSYIKYGLAFTI